MAQFQPREPEPPATLTHAELQRKLAQLSHGYHALANQIQESSQLLQECRSKLCEQKNICSIYEELYAAERAGHAKSSQALQSLMQDCSKLRDEISQERSPDQTDDVTPRPSDSSSSEGDEAYYDSAMYMTLFGEDYPLDYDSDEAWSPEATSSVESRR